MKKKENGRRKTIAIIIIRILTNKTLNTLDKTQKNKAKK